MKQKRLFFTVLSLVIASVVLLAGCAGTTTPTTTKGSTPTTTKGSTLEPYEIAWIFGGTSGQQKDVGLIEAEVNNYLKDKINATLKITAFDWGSYATKRDLMLSGNEKVDICFSASWNGYFENLSKGAYLNIADLLDQYAPKTKKLISPVLWEGGKSKGSIYGIPCNKEGAQDWGILYRKDITDKHGINMDSVKTIDDLEPILYQVHKLEPELIACQSTNLEPFYTFEKYEGFSGVSEAITVKVEGDKFTAISFFETPEVMQAWEKTHKWYIDNLVQKDVLTDQEHNNVAQQAGQVFSYVSNLKPYKDAESNIAASVGVVWKQIDITKAIGNQDAVAGSMMSIPAAAKNPARSIMFLELFNTDKYLNNLINFGIEGKHYKKTGENRIDYADGVTATTSGYNPQAQWVYGNQFLNYLWPSEKDDKWTKFQEYNDNAIPSKIVSFVFDSGPVKTEVASITNINTQYRNSLRFGAVDPKVVAPQFISKLKAAGLQTVIVEVQKQLDAWAAAKK